MVIMLIFTYLMIAVFSSVQAWTDYSGMHVKNSMSMMPDWRRYEEMRLTSLVPPPMKPAPVKEHVDDFHPPTRDDIKLKRGFQPASKFNFKMMMMTKKRQPTMFIVEAPRKSISYELPRITTITYPTVQHMQYLKSI